MPIEFFKPVDGTRSPRFAGIPTFMRLPHLDLDAAELVDIGIIGVPWDGGTTHRPGARHAPRQVRDFSSFMRNVHSQTGINPYELCNCADLGDADINPVNLMESMGWVQEFFGRVAARGITALTVGGDHLISLPVLRSLSAGSGWGMIHFDAHTDTHDHFEGEATFSHGTPFFHAIEEGHLDPRRVVQIGIRGCMYSREDREWGLSKGIRIIGIEEFMDLGIPAVIEEARRVAGDGPTYLSFDVDSLDPVYAPGTGTPEAGGFTTREAFAMLRGLRGLDLVGGDVVEISPPYDPSGNTALVGATLLFEILCLLAESRAARMAAKPHALSAAKGA